MMRVKNKSLLTLCLVTGLSLGLLSGCNNKKGEDPSSLRSPSAVPSSTVSNLSADSEMQRNLQTLKASLNDLKNFTNRIIKDNKVESEVNYQDAQQKVNAVAAAYNAFKSSLSDPLKEKIKFGIIDTPIKKLLQEQSIERKILADLTDKQYKKAQDALQLLGHYEKSKLTDGEDGSEQKKATQKLLNSILNTTASLTTLPIENISPHQSTPSPSPSVAVVVAANPTTTDTSNSWMWSLLNIVALFLVAICFFALWNNMSDVTLILKSKNKSNNSEESQLSILKNEIKRINNDIDDIKSNLKPKRLFGLIGGELNSSQFDQIEQKLNETKIKLQELYAKVIISHSSIVSTSDVTPYNEQQIGELFKKIDEINTNLKTPSAVVFPSNASSQNNASGNSKKENDRWLELLELIKIHTIDNESTSKKLRDEINSIKNILDNGNLINSNIKLQEILNLIGEKPFDSVGQVNLESKNSDLAKQIEDLKESESYLKQQLDTQAQQVNKDKDRIQNLEQNEEFLLEERIKSVSKIEELNKNLSIDRDKLNKLTSEKKNTEQDNEKLKADNYRLVNTLKNTPPKDENVSSQWRNMIQDYVDNLERFLRVNHIQEVTENEASFIERRNNINKPVIFNSDNSSQGYFIVACESDHLLFPKQHAIPPSQADTAIALFEGYTKGKTSKFILTLPAQVTLLGNGKWQLKHKGRLEYV